MSRRRAFALVELLFVLVPLALVFGLLLRASNDAIRLQRRVAEHETRTLVVDDLAARLRRVVAAATEWSQTPLADGLRLAFVTAEGLWTFELAADGATLTGPGGAVARLRADRLQFDVRLLAGTAGDVLVIVVRQSPPPESRLRADHVYVVPVALPSVAGARP